MEERSEDPVLEVSVVTSPFAMIKSSKVYLCGLALTLSLPTPAPDSRAHLRPTFVEAKDTVVGLLLAQT